MKTRSNIGPLQFQAIHDEMFSPGWPGFRPEVHEAPNSDGVVDRGKLYSHASYTRTPTMSLYVTRALHRGQLMATELARYHNLPDPCSHTSTLRALYYPPGVGGNRHTDFDLVTVTLYRSVQNPGLHPTHEIGRMAELLGGPAATPHHVDPMDEAQYSLVYFALPNPAVRLANGESVGEYLARIVPQSRVAAE